MNKELFLLLVILVLLSGCEEDVYKKAVYENSVQSYNSYLQAYPNTTKSLEIRERKENIYYVQALDTDKISYYKEYLEKYPSGRYVSKIKKLYEEKLFEIASEEDSILSYKKYLNAVPNSRHKTEAKERLALLAYYEVLAKDTPKAYKKYLARYVESSYGSHVKEKLKTLQEVLQLSPRVDKNKLNKLYWSRTDKDSLISLEVLLQKDVSLKIKKEAKHAIKKLINASKKILKTKRYEIQNVENKQHKSLKFVLPSATDVFISMTGEKSDKLGLGGAINKKVWLDSGTLKGPSSYIPSSGIPIGGELTNMLNTNYMRLLSGEYTLNYKTDTTRAWSDFGVNPPLNEKWGISLYFLEFGKDLLPQVKVINKYFNESPFKTTYKDLETLSLKSKIKSIEDKKKIKKLSAKLFDFNTTKDVQKIEIFMKNNKNNNYFSVLQYSLIYKKLLRLYGDIKFSKVNVSDGVVQAHRVGWFEQSIADEGIARTFTDESEATDAILSGDGGYFTRIRAKQYYFTGYVENTSQSIRYNLDIRCDFNFKTITEVGVWKFKKRIESTTIKSKHFKIKSLRPHERKAYACKIKSNAGGAVNFGLLGGSASLFINEWQVNVTEINNTNISQKILTKQEELLKEAGLYTIDFNADDVISPSDSVNRLKNNINKIF